MTEHVVSDDGRRLLESIANADELIARVMELCAEVVRDSYRNEYYANLPEIADWLSMHAKMLYESAASNREFTA